MELDRLRQVKGDAVAMGFKELIDERNWFAGAGPEDQQRIDAPIIRFRQHEVAGNLSTTPPVPELDERLYQASEEILRICSSLGDLPRDPEPAAGAIAKIEQLAGSRIARPRRQSA